MANKRKIFQTILILSVLLGMCVQPLSAKTLQQEVTTNQYTQLDEKTTDWTNNQTIPETYQKVAENDLFELYANPDSLAFKVLDKRSGYVWHSNLDEKEDGDRLNKTWTAFAQSGISIDFMDLKAISTRASITNSENSIDFMKTSEGFEATVTFTVPSISITVKVSLEGSGVKVEIPNEMIVESNEEFKLGIVYVYPFFGYTRGASVPGYMFIPDGAGSLIRFAETTKAKNMFYGRYYGSDLGMLTKLAYDPTTNRPYNLSIPVFGMVHGFQQNAFIALVEKGASYGELQVHPSGIITNFNFLYNIFVYNESYFQATNRSGAGVTTIQKETNRFDIQMHYRFLTGEQSDYVGMAKSYQEFLLQKGDLSKVEDPESNIGIKLEFLAGEKEKVLFWDRLIPMTTIEQAKDILINLDVFNPDVVYYGWQPLGASTMGPKKLKIDKGLGSLRDFEGLIQSVSEKGGELYLYVDPQSALLDEKGYSPRYDLAMSITNTNIQGFNRNKVNNYLNFAATKDLYVSISEDIDPDLKVGLALDSIGSMLYSDFKGGNLMNREDFIQNYRELFAQENGNKSFYSPNDYLFAFLDGYYDMPISTSGYLYTTDTVPFLQIVLSGYIPYFGSALNFSSDLTTDLLRHADFGVYPSFYLTNEVTAEILNTNSSWIYTSSIDQWEGEIERAYAWLDNLLAPVKGEQIVARLVVADGIVSTRYTNGKQILVNYTTNPYTFEGVQIKPKDAVIMEVKP